MLIVALIIAVIVLLCAALLVVKAITPMLRVYSYDKSTELLIKQRDLKRSSMRKIDKAIKLNELDIEIDNHLKDVEVGTARTLAEA